MMRLASIVKQYEKDFIKKYERSLLPSHYKTLSAIKICRSTHSPKMMMRCESKDCSHQTLVPHSCGHRHCPHCQNHETQVWIERQLKKQVPADYFMLTFTLPKQLRTLAWQHQRMVYGLLFDCAWATIRVFCHNDKRLGGSPGAIVP